MTLVKKSALGSRGKPAAEATVPEIGSPRPRKPARRPAARQALSATERIDQATQELASGLGQAAAAASELQRSVDQISSGAEEAAGAAQESLGLVAQLALNFREARELADASRRQTAAVQTSFAEIGSQIEGSVSAIELNAGRQLATVDLIASLEEAAASISEIGANLADVSDQTSLLALNATIEAARAGDHGRGFAVVADEVRGLAETSEASAGEVQALALSVINEVTQIAERVRASSEVASGEAQLGREVVVQLKAARDTLATIAAGAQEILAASAEAETATREAESGAEQVASAAEEQSAAAAEAQQALEQQSSALDQSQQTAESLGLLTQDLQSLEIAGEVVEQVAAAADQLSAIVQELSGASGQILVALEQIGRGTQVQASATLQANVAMGQIERSAEVAQSRAGTAHDTIVAVVETVSEAQVVTDRLVTGVSVQVDEVSSVLTLLTALSGTVRRIEKIADNLALVSVQTNMLAISGSVEATRAGEAGRGFSTVAGDVRKLSRDAAISAEQAKDAVRAMQDQVIAIRRDLDQVLGASEAEIARNRAILERFGLVVEEMEAVRASNGVILAGSDDMLRSVREIRSGTGQIAEAADLASKAATDAATAARQQAQSAEALAAAIEEIASIATALAVKAD
jgi:methyl-accepting chemotaxis protein